MGIGAAWGTLDKLWDQNLGGHILSQGFVENAAQAYADKIATTCKVK